MTTFPQPTVFDVRTFRCSSCGGDGGWNVSIGIDHLDGSLIERWCKCMSCDGTGDEEVVLLPVTEAEIWEAA